VKKGFDDLLDLAAEVSSGAACRQGLANLLEDLGNRVPEDKWVSNILPLFFVSGGCDRQVCNVAVLAASCVPAKGAVSAATAQSFAPLVSIIQKLRKKCQHADVAGESNHCFKY